MNTSRSARTGLCSAHKGIPPGASARGTALDVLLRRNNAHEGNSMRTKSRIIALVAAIFAALALVVGSVVPAFAVTLTDAPATSKSLHENGDGTYTL